MSDDLTPEQRFTALARADGRALEILADEILAGGADISIMVGPEPVSSPVRLPVPGAGNTTVVLGHVALTRCSVTLGGTRGDGIRAGHDLAGAVAAAICDAEHQRGGEFSGRIAALCRAVHQAEDERRRARAELVARTTLTEPGGQ
ncbi:phosphonate metabolism PhnG family protein [Mycolicibacterium hassiacum DSM 44199]|jgi:alpha-D-ribose 1-methylphosphonate 5-triphosphate synthase subunit PhnG|uniref:Phosphonate metabolism PhnG family protein n=1 Tax=Mycolicibacterium hassiacum (strain DSM 44199 / CIP 105218 / JCM 12690 / 3849) TaxID=1122247 RepID=K5BJQ8_MYCHD|nr:phosphonate C-P lyase system protein PhnG [Mycolicibacterium hassiacum]EKF23539.1 phosphonate metabolism PhnG family protein [Mycolicibacterium hassiacum DSM 44199]MBX5486993.1 phosphonate C-P lyase system protein PhnG [Mycolicibacterium hassiacum]MDA4084798.1 phosphonate metabolism PhnG family protein [Mycolicibacterium hassiacum DSM 44199]PZN22418.1 MAG: phosphonate metabolism PhnG family protein [Mycolicibacterium hassiacum]VCT90017.1 hypothetical protein MHAS_01717 [Mycolicibacterium ha